MTDIDRDMQARIEESETRISKVVAPATTNLYDTLFGGTLLSWMDEVAFITATRYGRCPFVTVSLERIDFEKPIPAGFIVELVGRVEHVGRTSLKVRIDVFVEGMFNASRDKAVTGLITMVAIDESRKPAPIR